MVKKYILVLTCLLTAENLVAQKEDKSQILTTGFQFRPLIANKFFGAGGVIGSDRHLESTIEPKLGYSFGMVIRRGFTPKFSLEMGINYFKRNYKMTNVDDSLLITDVSDFEIVSYEIPVQALFYIRLSKQFYMNVSLGTSFNWFASDVFSKGNNLAFTQTTYINSGWLKMALLANIGWEYRTEKSGFFYIGASLHRPLFPVATTVVKYDLGPKKYDVELELTGSILTLDLRYFFNAKPFKKKQKKVKKPD